MQTIKNISKNILAAWFGLVTFIGFLILYPGFVFTLSNPKRYRYGHLLRKWWGQWLFLWGAIRVKQIIETPLDAKNSSYIIVPNHTSMLDIVSLTVKLPLYFNFMAKMELGKVPLFGIFFRTIDISVDRKNARKAALAYQKAKDQLIINNQSIVIFPEGTIPENAPKLNRFKDGAFKLAIDTQKPLLPVTIIGNWILLPDNSGFFFRPGKVIQFVHAPISTVGLTDSDIPALKQKVFDIIATKLAEYGYFE
jgi:1-acyl-sn-glycerol-3-phosphate acyltransferase